MLDFRREIWGVPGCTGSADVVEIRQGSVSNTTMGNHTKQLGLHTVCGGCVERDRNPYSKDNKVDGRIPYMINRRGSKMRLRGEQLLSCANIEQQ